MLDYTGQIGIPGILHAIA